MKSMMKAKKAAAPKKSMMKAKKAMKAMKKH